MAIQPLFAASAEFADRITEMYDFVWPTAAAMWNLRWQVSGFVAANPGADKQLLHARFVEGSGVRGENLERACIEYDWPRQQNHFARIVLVNLFAHYEGWCKAIADRFQAPEEIERDLQFWERRLNGKVRRFSDAVLSLATQQSPIMAATFSPVYKTQSRYSSSHLEAMLKCLRFFKELRNCVAHQGALVSQRLVDAYAEWHGFATTKLLGVSEVPRHSAPLLAQPCDINLRGVVGFGDLMLRVVETVDADLAGTRQAEEEFVERWRRHHGKLKLKPSTSRIQTQIDNALGRLGMYRVTVSPDLVAFMRANALVT